MEEEEDECAFISGQDCDQNGICKYCAMCLQSACILSKSIGNSIGSTCNSTQFGTTNLYNWYDYCLSSDNDNSGNYCATSTECYQYKKSTGPSVSYAWHNLTCNPSTCMLIASNGAPPPIPIPPQAYLPDSNNVRVKYTSSHDISTSTDRHHYYHDSSRNPFNNPTAIALIIVSSLVTIILIYWLFRLFRKRGWCPFQISLMKKSPPSHPLYTTTSHPSVISSVPSSAPPSFSSVPPDMAVVRHPHVVPSIRSTRSSSSLEPLPSYLSPYPPPPKYEQAIVTQIRDLREDPTTASGSSSSSSSHTAIRTDHHRYQDTPPSMWVPVYFTQQQANFRRGVNSGQVFGFTPSHSYWLQQLTQEHPSPLNGGTASQDILSLDTPPS